jgi:hypothetical protein
MGATDSAHEIDDRHDHDPWCDYPHAYGYCAAALDSDNPGSGRNDDEEECAPGFRKKAAPFVG